MFHGAYIFFLEDGQFQKYSHVILFGIDSTTCFFQPVIHDWCNKGSVCVIMPVGWCI